MGCHECGDETSGSIEFREFLDLLANCWLLTKNSVPWSYYEGRTESHEQQFFVK